MPKVFDSTFYIGTVMSLLRPLSAPFVHVPRTDFSSDDVPPVSWSQFVRLIIGLSADLSIICWGLAFIGSAKGVKPYIAYGAGGVLLLTGGILYWLVVKEHTALIRQQRGLVRKAVAILLAAGLFIVASVIPILYGLENGDQTRASHSSASDTMCLSTKNTN